MTSEKGLVERLRAVLQSRPITLRVPQVYHDPVHDNPWGLFADDIAEAATLITTLQAENRVAVEALRRLSDASDEINGAIDDQIYDERASDGFDSQPNDEFSVTLKWGDIHEMDRAICGAQSLFKDLASHGAGLPDSPSVSQEAEHVSR